MKRTPLDPRRHPDPTGRAAEVVRFIQQFDLWEGELAGEPMKVHPFQQAMIKAIYGPSKRSKERLAREAYIWMPRGNGKTALISSLSLLHLVMPGFADPGASVILAASDKEQAGIAYKHISEMARSHPGVASMLKIIDSQKRIKVIGSPNELKVISSEAYSKHGMAPSFFLADEIHAWEPTKAHDLWNVVSKGMAKRTNPLTISLSTAGKGTGTLAADKWKLCEAVQKTGKRGAVVPFFIGATEYEGRRKWRSPDLRRKVNPAIAAGFLNEAELEKELDESKLFPRLERDYRQYRLNLWQEGADSPWISPTLYDSQPKRRKMPKGAPCAMGIDLARSEDLIAAVTAFPSPDGGFDVLARHWVVKQDIEIKAARDEADYELWVSKGFMEYGGNEFMEDGPILDYCKMIHEEYDLRRVSADPYQAQGLLLALDGMGIEAFAQRQNMNSSAAPMNQLEQAIKRREFRHGADPALRYCFLNAVVVRDRNNNPQLHKAKSTGRVDGVAASWMAVGYWGTEAARAGDSPWESDDFSLAELIA